MKVLGPEVDQSFIVRGTEICPGDAQQQYLQKLARIMLDEMSGFIGLLTPNGILLECNRAALQAGGLTRDEVIGKPFWEAMWWTATPKTREDLRHAIRRAAQGEFVRYDVEVYARNSGKEIVVMDFSLMPVRDDTGHVVFLLAEGRDITARKAHECERKSAQEASQRLAAIVESSNDAIVSKDLNGIVTSWNPAAEKMFGYTADEMIGRPITTIIPPGLQDDERRILETIARGERIEHFETIRLTKSGQQLEVSLTISPVKDEAGRIVGAAKIARDITQQKKAERVLQTSERIAAVGRLAATVAHEINNPLEALTNLVYLAKECAVQKDVRDYLAGAEEELDRISHLTKQTLGFYRETRGATPIKVGAMVNRLVSVFAPRTRNKAIEVHQEIRHDPEIRAVPGEVRQLVANLLSNSIDAVDPGGHIRIRVSAATGWNGRRRSGVRLTIADSGPGIPAAVRSKVFEPFFTTKKEVGTGLGLWACKSIVEKHQGSIRVKSSTHPHRSWTAVSVFLPSLAEEATEETLKPAV